MGIIAARPPEVDGHLFGVRLETRRSCLASFPGAMQRTLLAFYDDCRGELEVRRPSGQIFRFRVPQIGTYQVFAVEPQPDRDEVWIWTGTHGARRPPVCCLCGSRRNVEIGRININSPFSAEERRGCPPSAAA